jgi:hypothetical protein
MTYVQIDLADLLRGRSGSDLAVQRIAGFERHPIARVDPQNRGNIGVPPIVPGVRLGVQRFCGVDADLVRRHCRQRAARGGDSHDDPS